MPACNIYKGSSIILAFLTNLEGTLHMDVILYRFSVYTLNEPRGQLSLRRKNGKTTTKKNSGYVLKTTISNYIFSNISDFKNVVVILCSILGKSIIWILKNKCVNILLYYESICVKGFSRKNKISQEVLVINLVISSSPRKVSYCFIHSW